MSKIIVYHASYGCESGCCGHVIERDDDCGHFEFAHPISKETDREFAERLVREHDTNILSQLGSKSNVHGAHITTAIPLAYLSDVHNHGVQCELVDSSLFGPHPATFFGDFTTSCRQRRYQLYKLITHECVKNDLAVLVVIGSITIGKI